MKGRVRARQGQRELCFGAFAFFFLKKKSTSKKASAIFSDPVVGGLPLG